MCACVCGDALAYSEVVVVRSVFVLEEAAEDGKPDADGEIEQEDNQHVRVQSRKKERKHRHAGECEQSQANSHTGALGPGALEACTGNVPLVQRRELERRFPLVEAELCLRSRVGCKQEQERTNE